MVMRQNFDQIWLKLVLATSAHKRSTGLYILGGCLLEVRLILLNLCVNSFHIRKLLSEHRNSKVKTV